MINNTNEIALTAIQLIINEIEKKFEITILYACETGSRAIGVDVDESDYDVKGFYVAKEREYLRVIRSVNPNIIQHHMILNICDKEYDLDVEFKDIRLYLHEKIEKNSNRPDFWFKSKVVYRNLFPDEFLIELNKYLFPMIFIFSPNDKSGLGTLKKHIKNNELLINKKLLSLLISCIQYVHIELFQTYDENSNTSKFPFYNIFEEIEYLKTNKESFSKCFDEEEIQLIFKNLELVEGLYVRKKQGRVSTTKTIPDNLVNLVTMLTTKFNPEKKRKELSKTKGNMNLEWAQFWFEHFLYKYD
jgi:predicted nucleotidyltransferase